MSRPKEAILNLGRLSIPVALSFLAFPVVAGVIAPDFASKIDTLPPEAEVSAIVVMEDRVNLQALRDSLRLLTLGRAAAHELVIERLQQKAQSTRGPLLAFLEDKKALAFSQNEECFLVKYNTNLTGQAWGDGRWIEVFNTVQEKSIFRKEFPSQQQQTLSGAVYDNGSACVISSWTPLLKERPEKLPPRRWTIYFLNSNGELLGRSEEIETSATYEILKWDGSQATIASVEKDTGVLNILSVRGGK